MMITVREMINEGRDVLERAGVDSPEFDSKVLCSFVMGISLSELPVHLRDEAEEKEKFDELIRRRASHEPLQYITNEQDFMGLTFRTDERGLIPRLDTEILTENALLVVEELAEKKAATLGAKEGKPLITVLDMCCGTGAIGLSLAKLFRSEKVDLRVTLADISERVLSLAEENAVKLGFRESDMSGSDDGPAACGEVYISLDTGNQAELLKTDLFSSLSGRRFDIIVSNPPYIPTEEIEGLQSEVKSFEPLNALDGGEDGLDFYRKIVKEAPDHLVAGGKLLLEIGYDQAEAVTSLMDGAFDDVEVIKDLAGKDRVVRCEIVKEG